MQEIKNCDADIITLQVRASTQNPSRSESSIFVFTCDAYSSSGSIDHISFTLIGLANNQELLERVERSVSDGRVTA